MTAKLAVADDEMEMTDTFEQDYRASCQSPYFRSLIQEKQRIVGTLLIITLGFFIGMTLLAGYAKDFMTAKLIGSFNVGYGLILMAYFVCWIGALLYVRAANRTFDEKMKLLIQEHHARRR